METLESFFPNFGPENNYLLKKFSYRDGNSWIIFQQACKAE
jgi:hypothetical protein